jgi:hypothetical protein
VFEERNIDGRAIVALKVRRTSLRILALPLFCLEERGKRCVAQGEWGQEDGRRTDRGQEDSAKTRIEKGGGRHLT